MTRRLGDVIGHISRVSGSDGGEQTAENVHVVRAPPEGERGLATLGIRDRLIAVDRYCSALADRSDLCESQAFRAGQGVLTPGRLAEEGFNGDGRDVASVDEARRGVTG